MSVEDDEEELAARALHRLMASLSAALASFDASLSDEERAAQEICSCKLCEGMRLMRSALSDWERMQS